MKKIIITIITLVLIAATANAQTKSSKKDTTKFETSEQLLDDAGENMMLGSFIAGAGIITTGINMTQTKPSTELIYLASTFQFVGAIYYMVAGWQITKASQLKRMKLEEVKK